jgi:hypothetical protein
MREGILRILKFLYITQEVSNKGRTVPLGRGFRTAKRLNPYNPLSYIVALLFLVAAIIMFGVVGFAKEVDHSNPFKWN